MNALKQLPALGSVQGSFDCLQLMRLVHGIEIKLAGQEAIWCLAVKQAIKTKPARLVVDTVKGMATDNYNAVADVLGKKLTNQILAA